MQQEICSTKGGIEHWRRNDNVDKQLSHSLWLDFNTGPLFTMHDPCIPETLFHADDHIISSISLNQGDMSIRKQTHHRHRVLLPLLSPLCHSLSFSLCHSVTFITFLILSLSPPFLPPPSVFHSSREVTDWLNVCLSVGNEPANVANWACSIFICKPVNHCVTIEAAECTEAHLLPFQKSNGAQNEWWI